MKNVFLIILCLIFLINFSCNSNKTKDEQLNTYSDTTTFITDTVLNNVEIDNVQFTIMSFRDKLDEHREKFKFVTESPLTVVIINNNSNKIVYIKKFDFDHLYLYYSFHKWGNQSLNNFGKLYFEINTNAGGSGSSGKIYFFNFKNGIMNLNNIFDFNELSYTVFNKNDNEILLLEAIWSEGESHFEKHRYTISKYTCSNEYFSKNLIGQTKFKYASYNDEQPIHQTLSEIKLNEPILMESLYLDNYSFAQEKK